MSVNGHAKGCACGRHAFTVGGCCGFCTCSGQGMANEFPPYAPLPKTCTCCGKVYDAAAWASLPSVGDQMSEDEAGTYRLELRNCQCGSTIGIEYFTPNKGPTP